MHVKEFICFSLFFATFITDAVGNFCFRNRNPSGSLGQCDERISNINSVEECCLAGGAGWTSKQNGKRCSAACTGPVQPPVVQTAPPVIQPMPPVNRPNQEEVKFCFGTRQPNRRFGLCGEVIGERTREDCCRQGGKGWTNVQIGRKCEDPCLEVEDVGPVHYCFGRRTNRGRCLKSLGQKTRLQCCQDGGNGWSPNQNGGACESACEAEEVPRPALHPVQVIHGGWSEWSDWDQCSVTCSEGTQSRRRTCSNPAPAHGGNNCVGPLSQWAVCDEGPCPIHGGWGNWTDAGECSATCYYTGRSVYRQMSRRCNNPVPKYGGRECPGPSIKNERCIDLPHCPVDGGWSEYGSWSECSQTCEEGIQTRQRTCTNPPPQYGGRVCKGSDTEEEVCRNRHICPVHGGWSDWGAWSPCDSPGCGVDGTRFRSRSCTNPKPKNRGNYCVGPIIDRETCSKCRKLGGWSEWSPWGPCSGDCDVGDFRQRYRICNNPPPQNGGWCEEEFVDFGDCEGLDPCPNDSGESGSGEEDNANPWPCDDEDGCNPFASNRVNGDVGEKSFSYSLEVSIEVKEDVEDCGEYDIYSLDEYNPGCGKQPEDGAVNVGGGIRDSTSYSFDYANNGGQGEAQQEVPQIPVDLNNDWDSDYNYDYGNNVVQGGAQPSAPQVVVEASSDGNDYSVSYEGNSGQGGVQLSAPQMAVEANSDQDDYSFSYDGNVGQGGAQVGASQAAIEANDDDGSDSYSFDDNVGQGGAQAGAPQAAVEANEGNSGQGGVQLSAPQTAVEANSDQDDYSFSYDGNVGQGGAQVGASQAAIEANDDDGSDSYSFDDNVGQGGAQAGAPQAAIEANDDDGSDSNSLDDNVGQGGAQAGAPQAAIEGNIDDGSDSYSFDDVEGVEGAVEQVIDGQGEGGNNVVGDDSYSYSV